MEKISVIMTHWAQNDFRSETLRVCLESLIETTKHLPCEIIVVDNGASLFDSQYLLGLAHDKKIQHYLRNSENLYFGWGRNVGASIASGEYLVFTDNDIQYYPGWLDKCLDILRFYPEKKIAVTPLRTDRTHRKGNQYMGTVTLKEEKFPLNIRAGSNSWVMRRQDFDIIGKFRNHRIAGSYWTDSFVRAGYVMVAMDDKPMAADIGFKKGYQHNKDVKIKKIFSDGSELIINN